MLDSSFQILPSGFIVFCLLHSYIPIPFSSWSPSSVYLHHSSTISHGQVFVGSSYSIFFILEKEYSKYGWDLSDLDP